MINIDFININNATLVGRLLPFWARGRKISLFLQAILSPLTAAHNSFKIWALERFIECHITSQRSSLEWFLKYKLKQHFLNKNDTFSIVDGIDRSISCFSNNKWTNQLPWDNQMHWSVSTVSMTVSGTVDSTIKTNNEADTDEEIIMLFKGIVVYAPAIVNTVNYNTQDYERDIRYIMSKYMINFRKINIIIANTNKKS